MGHKPGRRRQGRWCRSQGLTSILPQTGRSWQVVPDPAPETLAGGESVNGPEFCVIIRVITAHGKLEGYADSIGDFQCSAGFDEHRVRYEFVRPFRRPVPDAFYRCGDPER